MDLHHVNKENPMKRKILSTTALLAVMLSGVQLQAESARKLQPVPGAKELIAQAEATRKEVASIGYEWRETGTLIKKAQTALEDGLEDDAKKLAREALLEGQQALKQGQNMKKNWQSLIPAP